MILFPVAIVGILLGTLLPAYVGLFAAVIIGGKRPQYLAALSIGIFLWFFSDTIGDSSYLGVNEGLAGGLSHLALVVLFALGLFMFLGIETRIVSHSWKSSAPTYPSFAVTLIVAVAFSVHGLAEGMGLGSLATSSTGTSLFDALGGLSPAVSYSLHKALEALMLGATYVAFALMLGLSGEKRRNQLNDLVIAGAIFAIPSLIGTAIGYYAPFDATYVFALGGGASLYVLFKLVQALGPANRSNSNRESTKMILLALLGFLLIYAVATLHSVGG